MNLQNRKAKIERLEKNLEGISRKIDDMVRQQRDIKFKIRDEESKLSIEENAITLKDVQFATSKSGHWVGHFDELEKYVAINGEGKYCEFNGWLYLVSDVIEHNMSKSYGRYEDLK